MKIQSDLQMKAGEIFSHTYTDIADRRKGNLGTPSEYILTLY